MTRDLLPYFNASYAPGPEGFMDWANITMDNWLIPLFLLIFWAIGIYVSTKSEYKMGGWIAIISLGFFIVGMIAQTYTSFNQLVMFIFAIAIVVGIIISFVENARS